MFMSNRITPMGGITLIDPRKVTPLLSNMTVDCKLAKGPSGNVYAVSRRIDGKKLALKHISIPTSDAETRALIYAGAVKNEAAAQRYYTSQVKELKNELLLLNNVKNAANLLKFRGYQVDQKYTGVGYDVYLLSDFYPNLPDSIQKSPLTKLQAVNLAIDLCSALEQLRGAGLIHKDVQPRNVFFGAGGHYLLGDLGLSQISDLNYSSMPDAMITCYTAPEVLSGDAVLSDTMDIYSVGVILYEVYNGGELPLDEAGRLSQSKKQPLAAPQYADVAMSEIILKACALRPADRYETPTDMKQALLLYLQRSSVTSEPLVPIPEPTKPEKAPDDASVDIDEIAATIAAGQAAEHDVEAGNTDDTVDAATDDAAAEATVETAAPQQEPETPPAPKRVIGDDDLLIPDCEDQSVESFMATLRASAGLEVFSMDDQGNMSTVPGYETEETLPDDTQFLDSADNHFNVLQNLPDNDSAVAPEESVSDADDADASVSSPEDGFTGSDEPEQEPVPEQSEPNEEIPMEQDDTADEPLEEPVPPEDEAPRRRHHRRRTQNNDVNSYDSGTEDSEADEEDDEDENGVGSTWKKALIAIIVLLVIAAGGVTAYLFKTDTVSDMKSEVLSSTSVAISANLKNDTAMDVIATSTSGEEVARVPFDEAGTTVTGLSPNTTYSFTLKSTDGMFLLGSKRVSAKTQEMTNITAFSPTALGASTVTLALGGVGPQPEHWVITLTSDDGENLTFEENEIPADGIVLDGLTPETHYTATVSTNTGDTLGGTTTCDFTTMDYTELQSFTQTAITTDSISLKWSFSGTVPELWTVNCEGTDGSSTSKDVTGTECTIDGLTSGVSYTFTLSTDSLKPTDDATLTVGIPSLSVSSITSALDDDGNVEVNWEYTGDTEPTEWRISYAYNTTAGTEVTPTTVTSDTNSVTLTGLIPDTTYTITVVGADELSVGGDATTTCQTAEAEKFTKYGCHDVSMDLYVKENNPDSLTTPSTTFTTSQHISFTIEAGYEASDEDKSVDTTYVIRDAGGNPVMVYTSTRSWTGSWTVARHTGDLPNPVTTPGSYTLEVYFDGDLMASADFTVTE